MRKRESHSNAANALQPRRSSNNNMQVKTKNEKRKKGKCKQNFMACHELQKFTSDTPAKITVKMNCKNKKKEKENRKKKFHHLKTLERKRKAANGSETLFSLQLFNLFCTFSVFYISTGCCYFICRFGAFVKFFKIFHSHFFLEFFFSKLENYLLVTSCRYGGRRKSVFVVFCFLKKSAFSALPLTRITSVFLHLLH